MSGPSEPLHKTVEQFGGAHQDRVLMLQIYPTIASFLMSLHEWPESQSLVLDTQAEMFEKQVFLSLSLVIFFLAISDRSICRQPMRVRPSFGRQGQIILRPPPLLDDGHACYTYHGYIPDCGHAGSEICAYLQICTICMVIIRP